MTATMDALGQNEGFNATPVRATFQGQPVEIYATRFTLGQAAWMKIPIPQLGVIKWTLRNENAAVALDVSYEVKTDAGNPNYFSLTTMGSSRDSVSETWVPPAIWVRRNVADQAVYLEIVTPPGIAGDAISELLGGDADA